MDQTQQPRPPPQQRELVYCHQCENEWYRDEHGIICPECQGDFTEVIEADQDPRADDQQPQFSGGNHGFYAPDPDEGDIDDFQWNTNGPGQPLGGHFTGTINRNMTFGANRQQGGMGAGGGIMGLLGPALQGILAGQRQRTPHGDGAPPQERWSGQEAPGLPHGFHQTRQGGNGNSFVRHSSGPGYSYTITTSSNHNLFPRDASGPQPFQGQPDRLERMMAQMFMNIGAMPGHHHAQEGGGIPGGPMFMEMGAGQHPDSDTNPFGHLLHMLGVAGGPHGDAVYSQEALDRIITQLMEQHQSGNAPGPASADAIESLAKKQISQKDLSESGTADCSICMDEAALGSTVTELPCGHWFHHDCIKAWLGEHDTCPHCRQGIMPKDEPNTDRPRQPSQAPHNDTRSPEHQRNSVPGEYPEGGETGNSENTLFGRMRQAFSPGASTPQGSNTDRNDRNTPGR